MYNRSDSNTSAHTRIAKPLEILRTSNYPETYSIIHYLSPTPSKDRESRRQLRHGAVVLSDAEGVGGEEAAALVAELAGGGALSGVPPEKLQDGLSEDAQLGLVLGRQPLLIPRQHPPAVSQLIKHLQTCLLYTSPSPRD